MGEKKRKYCNNCDLIVICSFAAYAIVTLFEFYSVSAILKVIFASIATLASIFRFCIEFKYREQYRETLATVIFCLFFTFVSAYGYFAV